MKRIRVLARLSVAGWIGLALLGYTPPVSADVALNASIVVRDWRIAVTNHDDVEWTDALMVITLAGHEVKSFGVELPRLGAGETRTVTLSELVKVHEASYEPPTFRGLDLSTLQIAFAINAQTSQGKGEWFGYAGKKPRQDELAEQQREIDRRKAALVAAHQLTGSVREQFIQREQERNAQWWETWVRQRDERSQALTSGNFEVFQDVE